jgi:hypothetical protein
VLQWGELARSLQQQVRIDLFVAFCSTCLSQDSSMATAARSNPSMQQSPTCYCLNAHFVSYSDSFHLLTPQEESERAYSHLPPDPFSVQESLSNHRAARNGKLNIGVEENSRRVGDYTRELDQYLVVSA